MDPPDNMYRVRMSCQMLRICGDYLTSSNSKRRLNFFLKYFQRYYVYKRTLSYWEYAEFPHSVQEFYEETFKRLRGRWKLAKTMEEAEKDIVDMDEQLRKKVKNEDLKAVISSQAAAVVRLPVGAGSSKKKKVFKAGHQEVESSKVPTPQLKNIPEEEVTEEAVDEEVAVGDVDEPVQDPYDKYEQDGDNDADKSGKDFEDEEFLAAFEKMCAEANLMAQAKPTKADLPVPMSAAAKQNGNA